MAKRNKQDADDFVRPKISHEYYTKRVEEILKDKYLIPLLYLIGKENNIKPEQVDKDKNKLYFKEHILQYLKKG